MFASQSANKNSLLHHGNNNDGNKKYNLANNPNKNAILFHNQNDNIEMVVEDVETPVNKYKAYL